jgi:hypothetical protein
MSLTEAGFLKTPPMNNRQLAANRIAYHPSFAMAASMQSTGACSIASGSRSRSGVP